MRKQVCFSFTPVLNLFLLKFFFFFFNVHSLIASLKKYLCRFSSMNLLGLGYRRLGSLEIWCFACFVFLPLDIFTISLNNNTSFMMTVVSSFRNAFLPRSCKRIEC